MSRSVRRPRPPDWQDYADRLEAVREAPVNFEMDASHEVSETNGWNLDHHEIDLPWEAPGPPVPGGSWETACELARSYAFPDPRLITGIFSPDEPLSGRPMLLRARFLGFTFWFGVRLTEEVDTTRETSDGPVRVWGFGYYTLEGHFERGQITFEVQKHEASGRVMFHIDAYSQPDRIRNPFYRIGFKLFGRRLQLRFARTALDRMQRLTAETLAARAAGAPDPTPDTTAPQPPTPEAEAQMESIQETS